MMLRHQFFAWYANTPLEYRHYPIIISRSKDFEGKEMAIYTNLNEVYIKVREDRHDSHFEIHPEVEKYLLEHTLSK